MVTRSGVFQRSSTGSFVHAQTGVRDRFGDITIPPTPKSIIINADTSLGLRSVVFDIATLAPFTQFASIPVGQGDKTGFGRGTFHGEWDQVSGDVIGFDLDTSTRQWSETRRTEQQPFTIDAGFLDDAWEEFLIDTSVEPHPFVGLRRPAGSFSTDRLFQVAPTEGRRSFFSTVEHTDPEDPDSRSTWTYLIGTDDRSTGDQNYVFGWRRASYLLTADLLDGTHTATQAEHDIATRAAPSEEQLIEDSRRIAEDSLGNVFTANDFEIIDTLLIAIDGGVRPVGMIADSPGGERTTGTLAVWTGELWAGIPFSEWRTSFGDTTGLDRLIHVGDKIIGTGVRVFGDGQREFRIASSAGQEVVLPHSFSDAQTGQAVEISGFRGRPYFFDQGIA